jgi:PAT family beta-lactamase induction signal transducer AmpG
MTARAPLPVWAMGLCNLPFGMFGAVMVMALPQLLASRGVTEQEIASVTAFAFIPGFCSFLLSPVLDVWLSRRTYAYIFGIVQALCLFLALTISTSLTLLAAVLFVGFMASVLFNSALGGWLGSLVPPEDESRLGAWFAIANFGGFGITAMVAMPLLRALPFQIGVTVLCLFVASPLLVFALLPAPSPDRRLASESFGRFFGDLAALVRQKVVLRTLPLFLAPCATFALTNTLGGLGNDFHASEELVSVVGGICTTIAAVIGSLAVPVLAARMPLLMLYLSIGVFGAFFSLMLILLPHTPAAFTLAMLGENVFGSASSAASTAIIFGTIGKSNPLAATQFAVLNAAIFLPVSYMQAADGWGYSLNGLAGSLATDAGLSLIACAVFAILFSLDRFRRYTPASAQPE